MRHATLIIVAVFLAAALGGVDGFIHSQNNVYYRYLVHGFGQAIAPAGAAHTAYQLAAPQRSELLFKIRHGNFLTFTDTRQCNRPIRAVQRKINHCRYCKTTLGC